MKRSLFAAFACIALLSGCASLTKSQVAAVNSFAETSNHFSAYPSKIISALAEIRIKRGLYYANSLDNADNHIEELNNLYQASIDDYKASAKADITFKIIDKYAQALLVLTADKHTDALASKSAALGTNLDSLITTYNSIPNVKQVHSGLGSLVAELIMAAGTTIIRTKQAKAIEQFVPAGDTLIAVMTGNLLEFLESTNIDLLIRNEEHGIQTNFKSFIALRKPALENERDYFVMKKDLDAIKTLRDQTVSATKHLRKTHAELTASVEKKKDLMEVVAALQAYYDSVKDVKITVESLNLIKK